MKVAGFAIASPRGHSKTLSESDHHEATPQVVRRGFVLRSRKRVSCFRRKRFPAISAAREGGRIIGYDIADRGVGMARWDADMQGAWRRDLRSSRRSCPESNRVCSLPYRPARAYGVDARVHQEVPTNTERRFGAGSCQQEKAGERIYVKTKSPKKAVTSRRSTAFWSRRTSGRIRNGGDQTGSRLGVGTGDATKEDDQEGNGTGTPH